MSNDSRAQVMYARTRIRMHVMYAYAMYAQKYDMYNIDF